MKTFLCLVVLAFVAVNAETPQAEASQAKPIILIKSAPQLLKIKPTLPPYKPLPLQVAKPKAVLISVQPQQLKPKPTFAPYKSLAIKVVPVPTPARRPVKPVQPITAQKGWAWG
ncbi:uncharacterized protein LOC129948136 [Eupeodes corollae]|uniref:uncharacterized protein LOC129948136 n=1 Tax=Eupeodes corollae TaxID=290404 RepID=UPI002493AB76|nr:uncharacterized protein LOC129948136 [Eupeodes corollae]